MDFKEKVEQSGNDYSDKAIVESLPIGTLVFRIFEEVTEIIAINDRLLQFANMVHTYVDEEGFGEWDKEKLYKAFSKNIYAFAADEDVPIVKELVKEAAETGYSQKVFQLRGTSGENTKWISAMCSCKEMQDQSRIYYTLFLDNTSQVLYEKQLLDKQRALEYISMYDSLTNLHNRYAYNQYLENSKTTIKKQTGIVFVDINGLKAANDEFGHLFGDSVIIGFADILQTYFEHDNIYRISGDEFIVIWENINVIDFEKTVNRFIDRISEQSLASAGYKWESVVVDLKQSIYQTEQLMMIEKQKYYANSSNRESRHRPQILRGLLEDLEEEQFMVYLQPKARLGSMQIMGAEALIRKKGCGGCVIPPYEFVPVLEKEFLISKIDFFVLEEVCRLLHKWKSEGRQLIKVSVNMSRVSVAERDFLEHVIGICEKYNVEHQYIEIEITESTDTKDDRKLPEIVNTLDELGFGVALDDMGSDYSSIKMLTMKGVDMVKIDRGLVLQIHDNAGAALIRYIIALCHEIGKKCIAEGVENFEQAAMLTDMGCDFYQGYLLNRPIPIAEFEKYLGSYAD